MAVNKRPVDMLSVTLEKTEIDRLVMEAARDRLVNERVDERWPPVVQRQDAGGYVVYFKAAAAKG